MFQVERIGGKDDNHPELIHKDNQLSAMSPREVEVMLACPGGPPLIAITDIAEGKASVCWKSASRIDIFRIPLQGIMHPFG